MNTTRIGLNRAASEETANKLNELLANYQVFYMNSRGFHWNIKGDKFFELHLKFEELYNDSLIKIDEIAERILERINAAFEQVPFVLLLNKADLVSDWEVSDQEIDSLSQQAIATYKTSGLSGDFVDEAFECLVKVMRRG